MNDAHLQSDRLEFRHWGSDDLSIAMSLWGDPAVTALIYAASRLTPEKVNARLQREVDYQRESGIQYWPLFLRGSNDFVGCCGLHPENVKNEIPELGFHLCKAHWGKGFAKEAASVVIDHAFSDLGITTLFAGHHPNNGPSARILLSLGFRLEGEVLYPPTGLYHPYYLLQRSQPYQEQASMTDHP